MRLHEAARVAGLPAPGPGGLHSAVRAGGSATPTGFAACAGIEVTHALTFNPEHSLGADHLQYIAIRKINRLGVALVVTALSSPLTE